MKKRFGAGDYLKEFVPSIVLSMKGYNGKTLTKDIIAGLVVGIIALPLSLALAIASGFKPEVGLVTAVIGGGIAAFLSGSRNQVSGPTAAFIPIVLSVAAACGPEGFLLATFMAGVWLLIMGGFKLGKLINYISLPIIAGFTTGIAVSIFAGQFADFMGYEAGAPKEFLEKVEYYITEIGAINIPAMILGISCFIIMLVMGKISKKIPSALVAILFAVAIQLIFKPDIETIGSRFGELKFKLTPNGIDFSGIGKVIMPSISIALLAAIESLLSAKAADSMAKTVSNPNMELVSQGTANIASSLFGGLPVTGAIARTSANIKNGGVTPLSTIIHAVTIFLIGILLMPYAVYIPLTSLAAVLIMVCKNMINVQEAKKIFAGTPRDIILFITALALTVIFDLVVAILSGMGIALLWVAVRFIIAKRRKQQYKPVVTEASEGGKLVIKISGALNFITDMFIKLSNAENYNSVVIDLTGAIDTDLQGFIAIVAAVKRYVDEGKTVKVLGNKKCVKYLFKINYREEERLDLTDILVEQPVAA